MFSHRSIIRALEFPSLAPLKPISTIAGRQMFGAAFDEALPFLLICAALCCSALAMLCAVITFSTLCIPLLMFALARAGVIADMSKASSFKRAPAHGKAKTARQRPPIVSKDKSKEKTEGDDAQEGFRASSKSPVPRGFLGCSSVDVEIVTVNKQTSRQY